MILPVSERAWKPLKKTFQHSICERCPCWVFWQKCGGRSALVLLFLLALITPWTKRAFLWWFWTHLDTSGISADWIITVPQMILGCAAMGWGVGGWGVEVVGHHGMGCLKTRHSQGSTMCQILVSRTCQKGSVLICACFWCMFTIENIWTYTYMTYISIYMCIWYIYIYMIYIYIWYIYICIYISYIWYMIYIYIYHIYYIYISYMYIYIYIIYIYIYMIYIIYVYIYISYIYIYHIYIYLSYICIKWLTADLAASEKKNVHDIRKEMEPGLRSGARPRFLGSPGTK